MKTLFSTLALTAALTSAALAEPGIPTGMAPVEPTIVQAEPTTPPGAAPVELTDAQMDQVTAGGSLKGGVVNDAVSSTAGGGNSNGHDDFRMGSAAGPLLGAADSNPTVSGGASFGDGNDF